MAFLTLIDIVLFIITQNADTCTLSWTIRTYLTKRLASAFGATIFTFSITLKTTEMAFLTFYIIFILEILILANASRIRILNSKRIIWTIITIICGQTTWFTGWITFKTIFHTVVKVS